jgi:cytochrome P450
MIVMLTWPFLIQLFRGKAWAHRRALLQQFFTKDELFNHTQKMNVSADRLLAYLHTTVSVGTEFEATQTLNKMTLEVIGTAAFGVDFHLQNGDTTNLKTPPSSPSSSPSSSNSTSDNCGFDLLSAAKILFQPLGIRGNKARVVFGFAPLLCWVQQRGVAVGGKFKVLKTMSLARCFIWGILYGILENISVNDSVQSLDLESKNKAGTTATAAAAAVGAEMTRATWQQCPIRSLDTIRAKSFTTGRNSLNRLVLESPLLFTLLQGVTDPQTQQPFTEIDICAQGFNIFLGGSETTALGLSYTLYELAKQPELQRQIAQEVAAFRALKKKQPSPIRRQTRTAGAAAGDVKEPTSSISSSDITFDDLKHLPFTEACFLEGLRLWPPVSPLIPMSRHATEEVDLDGYKIPKGACIMFNVWHLHHNPNYYTNPEKYTPERFLSNHPEMKTRHHQAFLPFGAGPRKCIGKAFAIAEVVITLAKMLEQFDFRVDVTRSAELDIMTVATLQPANGIWLNVFKREPEMSGSEI